MWSVEDSAKLLARVLGPSWWPDITWPRNFASGKGWEMEALWEQRLQKKIRMWSLFAGMSKLNVGGPFFAKQVLAFLQQNACLRKQIAGDQNDHLVMQSKDSAERAFHSQVCPMGVPYWGDAAHQVQVKLNHWFSAAGSKTTFPSSLECNLLFRGLFLFLFLIIFPNWESLHRSTVPFVSLIIIFFFPLNWSLCFPTVSGQKPHLWNRKKALFGSLGH